MAPHPLSLPLGRPSTPLAALLGMPGCGKSALAQRVGAALGWRVIDLDARIEQRAGQSCGSIIQERGEALFREWERDALREALAPSERPTLLAPGSGIVSQPENLELLASLPLRIWLLCPREELIARLGAPDQSALRPLAQAQSPEALAERIDSLWLSRREAWVALATHRFSQTDALDKTIALLGRAFLERCPAPQGSPLS